MIVKIEDLKVGDEIIISRYSDLRHLRILRLPSLGKQLHWKTKLPLYKSVKVLDQSSDKYQDNLDNPDMCGAERYIDLQSRDMYLIKRK